MSESSYSNGESSHNPYYNRSLNSSESFKTKNESPNHTNTHLNITSKNNISQQSTLGNISKNKPSGKINKLHTNQQLLVDELIARGAQISIINIDNELLEVSYNGRKDFLLDRFSSSVPFHVVKLTADKYFTKNILTQNNISCPYGNLFDKKDIVSALDFAAELYPVVVKPNFGSHGDNVISNIKTKEELHSVLLNYQEDFIIEQFYSWEEHRLFITQNNEFACVKREQASIIGNGYSSISELIKTENDRRKTFKNNYQTSICPIELDNEVVRFLKMQKLNMESVLPKEKKVFLRAQSNLAKGGLSIDMTEVAHPTVKELAFKTLQLFHGLPCAGLDLLCDDITKPINSNNYVILEVNSNPGLAMHAFPAIGKSQPVAAMLADVMFPFLKLEPSVQKTKNKF